MEYTWEVTGLKSNQSGGVVQTYWKKSGINTEGSKGVFSGATPFIVDQDSVDYIPFEQLTEETVLSWIQGVVVGSYEEHVNRMIQKQIDDLTVSEATMPWSPEPDTSEEPTP